MSASKLIILNTTVIIICMVIFSQLCPNGFSGGECVKEKDRMLFWVQLAANVLFGAYYLIMVDKTKWFTWVLNIVAFIGIFMGMAFLHSISKAGIN